ncbi:hypothetical protein STEG23_033443 [Scotinomys teguina]
MLIWVACGAIGSHDVVYAGLLWKVMSRSVTLQQPEAVVMTVVPIVIEGCEDFQAHCLSPCWCPRAMLQLEPYKSEWPGLLPNAMVTSGSQLQLGAVSGSGTLLHPGLQVWVCVDV